MLQRAVWLAAGSLVAALLSGCGAGGSPGDGGTGGTAGAGGTGGTGGSGAGAQGAEGGIGGGLSTGGGGAGTPLIDEVFGESADVLYRLDPQTLEVTEVGTFSGCENVLDLAIDKDNQIYGTTFDGLYRIDEDTAHCTLIAAGEDYPNSLSFVPAGTIDQNDEALVGYVDADYVRIDKATGAMTTIGSIAGGYISSGDIVSVINGGTYLTVKDNGCDDCLFQVDPETGDLTKNWGPLPYSQVFGLAYWGGQAYGFTNDGQLFQITFESNSVHCTLIPMDSAPESFWGAGSSTAVPVNPPR